MDPKEETKLQLEDPLLEEAKTELYTGDGSVDIKGKPVLKQRTGRWRACTFILGIEFCERLAYYGVAKNLVTFLTQSLYEGNAIAARNVTTWQGTSNFTPLIGAFLADTYWGRFWTLALFSAIYLIGLVTLTLSASFPGLMPSSCVGSLCFQESSALSAVFFVGLYVISLGTGGIRTCSASFGADQFDDTDPAERTAKSSFFNWSYFCLSVSSLISGTVLVWIQDNCGWSLGFAIPTLCMGIAIGSFFSGSKFYRCQKPGGNPFTRMCQVVVASLHKRKTQLPLDSSLLYELPGNTSAIEGSRKLEHTDEFRFLDKAAVVSDLDTEREGFSNPWRLCTVTQVEELKKMIKMVPIWATSVMFAAVYIQTFSMFLEQGMVLDKRLGSFNIPPASLSTFDVVSVMIWIPIYDRFLVPFARRFTGNVRGFSELQRMGIGLFLSVLSMAVAALVEMKRLDVARSHGLIHENVEVPMSILWQIPQYSLIGAAEVFTAIGQIEFFFNEAPDGMRSLCSAFALFSFSVGSYLSSILVTILTSITTRGGSPGWIPDNLNEGHLDRFFWLIAGLCFLDLLAFCYCTMKYKYRSKTAPSA